MDRISLATILGVLSVVAIWTASQRTLRRPPGPKGWPLIGNLFDAPKSGSEWVTYHQMCKKYDSDIVYLKIFGQSVLILDSLDAINDLLDKRSNIYSSRPRFTMLKDLMGFGWNFGLLPYGTELRDHRRLFHSGLNTDGGRWRYPQQTHGAHGLLLQLLERPDQWRTHIRYQAGSVMLEVAYGIKILPENDPLVAMAEKAMAIGNVASVSGKFLVDMVPILKHVPEWMPGASFQTFARESKPVAERFAEIPFAQVKQAMADGTARPSVTLNRLQSIDSSDDVDYQENAIKNCAATMFLAGADTTVASLSSFFLAMIKYPEVQSKAQRELDRVLGFGQLPSFGDEASLPYLSAIVKEVLRWEIPTPIGIPHQSTEDDEYRGYHIPAGTLVIPISWAVLGDENVYPNPTTFDPDRFMKDGALDPSVRDPEAVFGYGRRICPGRHMAWETIWLTIGCILACFSIEKPLDVNGVPFEPSVEYSPTFLRHPEPFDVRITPRSKFVEDIIRGLSA